MGRKPNMSEAHWKRVYYAACQRERAEFPDFIERFGPTACFEVGNYGKPCQFERCPEVRWTKTRGDQFQRTLCDVKGGLNDG